MRQIQLYLLAFLLVLNVNSYGQNKKTLGKVLNVYSLKIDKFLGSRYEVGLAILNNGDSIFGVYEFNDSKENYRSLLYIDSITKEKKTYEPRDVKYFYMDSLAFQPVETKDDGLVFMRIILSDKLKVYLHKQAITSLSVNKEVYQFYCFKPNGDQLILSYGKDYPFRSIVSKFFKDDSELYNKIKNYSYHYTDFLQIIEEYNDWLKSQK